MMSNNTNPICNNKNIIPKEVLTFAKYLKMTYGYSVIAGSAVMSQFIKNKFYSMDEKNETVTAGFERVFKMAKANDIDIFIPRRIDLFRKLENMSIQATPEECMNVLEDHSNNSRPQIAYLTEGKRLLSV